MFTISEKKIVSKIRREVLRHTEFSFWFIYDKVGKAIDYDGFYSPPKQPHFGNSYDVQSIASGLCQQD